MEHYYVNKNAQSNGDHEVHRNGCSYFPSIQNVEYLGLFESCHVAIVKSKSRGYNPTNGCFYCCNECHTS